MTTDDNDLKPYRCPAHPDYRWFYILLRPSARITRPSGNGGLCYEINVGGETARFNYAETHINFEYIANGRFLVYLWHQQAPTAGGQWKPYDVPRVHYCPECQPEELRLDQMPRL